MRYHRNAVYWGLIIFLAVALNTFAAIRPDSPANNTAPADSSQGPDATPAPVQAPAMGQAPDASTAIVPSLPLPVAPIPMGSTEAPTGPGFPWGSLLIGIAGIVACVVVVLKFSKWAKPGDSKK
jgi:hypothetical protein